MPTTLLLSPFSFRNMACCFIVVVPAPHVELGLLKNFVGVINSCNGGWLFVGSSKIVVNVKLLS
jgi:hypothetical protein